MSHSLGPISFGNRKFHAANEKAQNALMRGLVFFFSSGERSGKGFSVFSHVLNVFPSGSQVFNSPIAPRFYPVWFAQSSIPW